MASRTAPISKCRFRVLLTPISMLSKSTNTAIFKRSSTNVVKPPTKQNSHKKAQNHQNFCVLRASLWLFLEEVVKSAAGVGRFAGRGAAGCTAGVPGFPFDGCVSHEKLTTVAQVLLGDAFRDFLRALEPGGGIEMAAVFAGTKIGLAFR